MIENKFKRQILKYLNVLVDSKVLQCFSFWDSMCLLHLFVKYLICFRIVFRTNKVKTFILIIFGRFK